MTFKMIKPGITILAFVLKKLTLVVAMLLIVAYIAGCEFSDEPTFYPTLEQAFLAHSGVSSRRMPDILFLDEAGNSLTAFHPGGGAGAMMISHYIKELRDGEYWFACLSVASGGISIGFGDTSIEASQSLIHSRLADDGFDAFGMSRFHTRLGRRPLLGFSPNPNIRNLTINGVPVDYVIETTNAHGAPLFFWYYSDFPPIYGEKEDIIICLEPNQNGVDREICSTTTNSVLEDERGNNRAT